MPPIIAGARKRRAQETAGKGREVRSARLARREERLSGAEDAVRDDAEIRIDLPGTAVPAGRTVLTLRGLEARGRRGSGTRTAARDGGRRRDRPGPDRPPLARADRARPGAYGAHRAERRRQDDAAADRGSPGTCPARGVAVRRPVPVGYLPQRLDVLDDALTVADERARGRPRPPGQ